MIDYGGNECSMAKRANVRWRARLPCLGTICSSNDDVNDGPETMPNKKKNQDLEKEVSFFLLVFCVILLWYMRISCRVTHKGVCLISRVVSVVNCAVKVLKLTGEGMCLPILDDLYCRNELPNCHQ